MSMHVISASANIIAKHSLPFAKLKFTRKDLPEEMKNNDYGKFMIASEYYEDILKTIYEKIEEDLSELHEQDKL